MFNILEAISHKTLSDDGRGNIQVMQKWFVFPGSFGNGHDSEECDSGFQKKTPFVFFIYQE